MNGRFGEFVGVDGCRGGWVAVTVRSGRLAYEIAATFPEILAQHTWALILVDVPIGLREGGPVERLCDPAARQVLGGRAACVFPVPVRAALNTVDHKTASLVNRELTEGRRGLSLQSWAIAPKIREVNEALATGACPRPVVREMHPEVCFWALNDRRPLQHNKKTAEGHRERMALLSRHVAGAACLVEQVLCGHLRRVVQRDDVVDALVGTVTGCLSEGNLMTLPEEPERDSAGLPMEIVYLPA